MTRSALVVPGQALVMFVEDMANVRQLRAWALKELEGYSADDEMPSVEWGTRLAVYFSGPDAKPPAEQPVPRWTMPPYHG